MEKNLNTLHDDSTLTVTEVAEWLQVKPGWVRKHATGTCRPKLPSEKLGKYLRFRWGDLKAWRQSIGRVL